MGLTVQPDLFLTIDLYLALLISTVALDLILRSRIGIVVGSQTRHSTLSPEKLPELDSTDSLLQDSNRSALSLSILRLSVGVLCLLQVRHFRSTAPEVDELETQYPR